MWYAAVRMHVYICIYGIKHERKQRAPGTPAPPRPSCAPGGPGTGTPASTQPRSGYGVRLPDRSGARCLLFGLLTGLCHICINTYTRQRTSATRPPASSRRRRASPTAGRGRGRLDRRTALDSSGRAAVGRHAGARAAGGGRVLSARRLPRPLDGCRRTCTGVGVLFVQRFQHGLDSTRLGDLILVGHPRLPYQESPFTLARCGAATLRRPSAPRPTATGQPINHFLSPSFLSAQCCPHTSRAGKLIGKALVCRGLSLVLQ
jgi:hypothetical protein